MLVLFSCLQQLRFSFFLLGYISAAARREAVSITMDSLENLHRSLASCPKETEKESTPSCLTVPLLAHQERALKWLLWRETQIPAGKRYSFQLPKRQSFQLLTKLNLFLFFC